MLDTENVKSDIKNEMQKFVSSLDKPRILLAGSTGCGKSTLCNLVFKRDVCAAGSGRPQTRGIREIQAEDIPVIIHDSEGYETGANFGSGGEGQDYFSIITDFMDRQDENGNPVDIIWYCISSAGARVTDADISVIKEFRTRRRPIAVILTQADMCSQEDSDVLADTVKSATGSDTAVFESSTDPMVAHEIDTSGMGIDALYEWTLGNLEESRKDAFMIACGRAFDRKYDYCVKLTREYSAMAGTAAVSPVPFSDAAIITPVQLAMVGRILSVWNMNQMQNLLKAACIDQILPMLGRFVAGNIIKFIPGIGQIMGGIVNASVAFSLTYGLGKALNETCRMMCERELAGLAVNFSDFFGDSFIENVKKYAKEARDWKEKGLDDEDPA